MVAPFVTLVPLAWLISRLFSGSVRDGVLALGVSSTEVAAVGLVALAGGSAVLALGALTGSLVVSALAGPLCSARSPAEASDVAAGALVRPLRPGRARPVGRRALLSAWPRPRLEHADARAWWVRPRSRWSCSCTGAMSGARPGWRQRCPPSPPGALFLLAWRLPAAAWAALAPAELRSTGALVVELRDFAVAAALAAQAFGPAAATVSGVYGVLMLLLGSAAAHLLPRFGGGGSARPDRG